ncbi:hypothetical protein, partial [Aeromonas caviae]
TGISAQSGITTLSGKKCLDLWGQIQQHTYLANRCIDLGKGAPEIHGSWSLLNNLQDWRWTCR